MKNYKISDKNCSHCQEFIGKDLFIKDLTCLSFDLIDMLPKHCLELMNISFFSTDLYLPMYIFELEDIFEELSLFVKEDCYNGNILLNNKEQTLITNQQKKYFFYSPNNLQDLSKVWNLILKNF